MWELTDQELDDLAVEHEGTLALYQEHRLKPRRADDAMRITLVMLSHLIEWRATLTIVKPDTLIRWHRNGFQLVWRWKSRAPGRPPLPLDVQQLMAAMARENATWGADRRGTAPQAWPVRVAADGTTLHATGRATAELRVVPAMEHFRAQPRQRRARL